MADPKPCIYKTLKTKCWVTYIPPEILYNLDSYSPQINTRVSYILFSPLVFKMCSPDEQHLYYLRTCYKFSDPTSEPRHHKLWGGAQPSAFQQAWFHAKVWKPLLVPFPNLSPFLLLHSSLDNAKPLFLLQRQIKSMWLLFIFWLSPKSRSSPTLLDGLLFQNSVPTSWPGPSLMQFFNLPTETCLFVHGIQCVVTAFYGIKAVKLGFSGDRKIKADFMKKVKLEPDLAG